ncbi:MULTISPECIES: HupE/UreJ family protein [Nocardioides]|uniref:HupE/UreJ family protein n=1 Tax=Nocardioides vastitatis TaxID=2568655 RepID=A0ABW0ZFU2_9ACTN|nr:HupE/UreJ family protein [Nocardioides sp.]THJ13137.1 HupE/UreJ family protein [Nocardioides sp.]
MRLARRAAGLAGAVAAAALSVALVPSAAHAHSLDSSTISLHVSDTEADATVTIAMATLDQALGTDYSSEVDVSSYSDEVVAYLGDHLELTGADGTVWTETFTSLTRESVEGIDSVSVDVVFDTGGASTSGLEIEYDAVIEAIPDHDAVVVLTDAAGQISTPGVLTSSDPTLTVAGDTGSGATPVGLLDMVEYGFQHVLEGADHLMFLTALLLTAPVVVVAGRWRRRTDVAPTLRDLATVVTAFTVGHSATLIAASLGWVQAPTTVVEVLVAVSVGVAAVHAVRPLVPRGEALIAAGFGLVHGLAFAGILTDLGLEGSRSVPPLLAFNLGVELAQLTATAALFPSLYALARTRFYPGVRLVGGCLALVAATGWALERVGLLGNPFRGVEAALVAHPWYVVLGLAVVALTGWALDARQPVRNREAQPGPADLASST